MANYREQQKQAQSAKCCHSLQQDFTVGSYVVLKNSLGDYPIIGVVKFIGKIPGYDKKIAGLEMVSIKSYIFVNIELISQKNHV